MPIDIPHAMMCQCPQCTGRDEADAHNEGYAEGYRAGRIAALREVGCLDPIACRPVFGKADWCRRCRLLAEAESGEDTGAE